MPTVPPLTPGIEIARAFGSSQSGSVLPPTAEDFVADPFVNDRITLSKQSLEKQQGNQIPSPPDSAEAPAPSNESVSVSSSVGQSNSRGNLTAEEAVRIYQAVAGLL